MTLRQKQSVFVRNVAKLIQHAEALGYELTFGDAWRDPARHGVPSELKGVHPVRLAIDLNLFQGGQYLASTESHRPLGEFWKTLHAENRWGGDFRKPDGNHYSMAHGGKA